MAITIKIEHDLTKLSTTLDRVKRKAARLAVRQALNKTIVSTRSMLNRGFRGERKLKLSDINNKHTSMRRATGMDINDMEAQIKILGKSLSLINFVRGQKMPRMQKGIKVHRRKSLRFEIKPSQIKNRGRLFIARGKNDNVHVFRRVGKKLLKQNAPGLAEIFGREAFSHPIKLFARKTFAKEFGRAFSYQLSKVL